MTHLNGSLAENLEIYSEEALQEQDSLTSRENQAKKSRLLNFGLPDKPEVSDPAPDFSIEEDETLPSGDSLAGYFRSLGRYPRLSREQELDLFERYQAGDRASGMKHVNSHLRLVVKLAMGMGQQNGLDLMDLIQAGNIGLMRSLQRYSPEKGVRFGYYAAYWIKAHIWLAILDSARMVKIGTTQNQRRLFFNLNRMRQQRKALGLDADCSSLAAELGVSEAEVNSMDQRLAGKDQSLNIPTAEDSSVTRQDLLQDQSPEMENFLSRSQLNRIIREESGKIVSALSEKERSVLYDRLLSADPVTLREIGERFGVSRERMRQVESALLLKFREHLAKIGGSEDWLSVLE